MKEKIAQVELSVEFLDDGLVKIPVSKLIIEDIDELEGKLKELGAKTVILPYHIPGLDISNPLIQSLLGEAGVDVLKMKTIIILRDGDLPLAIVLSSISNIVIFDVEGKQYTGILWSGGGSSIIDVKFHDALKKLWLKTMKFSAVLPLHDQRNIMGDLAKKEGFSENYALLEEYREKKLANIESQDFATAAEFRHKEKEIMEKLGPMVISLLLEGFDEYFHKILTWTAS